MPLLEVIGALFSLHAIIRSQMVQRPAGISVKQPVHVLRHSFAYYMIRGGTNPAYLQQLMGHQDIRTTMAYLRLTQTDLTQQTDCLPALS